MASQSSQPKMFFTAAEVAEILTNSQSDDESNVDSETGGMSSEEEFELDQDLQGISEPESDDR
jgi:hypothetical protein